MDDNLVLESFRSLQRSNQRRNAAIKANLELAADPQTKLSKLIHLSNKILQPVPVIFRVRQSLSPQSYFRFVWDALGFFLLVYYMISIPFYMAFFFGEKVDLYYHFVGADFTMDAYWVVDILCKLFFFSFQIEASAELCKDGEQIRMKYLNSGYFAIDCIASIPLEIFVLLPGVHREAIFFFRAIHLLRVSQLFNYWSLVGSHLSKNFKFFVGRSTSLLLKAGLGYIIANHLFACIYFSIHRYAERNMEFTYVTEDGFATYNEETHQHDICNTRISYCYSRSIYFVANTMTSVSYGDISPFTDLELLWEVVMEILCAFIAATFLGFCSIFLEHRDATGDKSFNAKLANIENYCNYRKLPSQLKSTIVAQYSFLWRKNRSLRGTYNEVLTDLSEPCLMEVCVQLCAGVIEAVPILRDSSYHIRRRVAAALKPQVSIL